MSELSIIPGGQYWLLGRSPKSTRENQGDSISNDKKVKQKEDNKPSCSFLTKLKRIKNTMANFFHLNKKSNIKPMSAEVVKCGKWEGGVETRNSPVGLQQNEYSIVNSANGVSHLGEEPIYTEVSYYGGNEESMHSKGYNFTGDEGSIYEEIDDFSDDEESIYEEVDFPEATKWRESRDVQVGKNAPPIYAQVNYANKTNRKNKIDKTNDSYKKMMAINNVVVNELQNNPLFNKAVRNNNAEHFLTTTGNRSDWHKELDA